MPDANVVDAARALVDAVDQLGSMVADDADMLAPARALALLSLAVRAEAALCKLAAERYSQLQAVARG